MTENERSSSPNLFIKGLRRQLRPRALSEGDLSPIQAQLAATREREEREQAEELADARASSYYWWWVFLRESDEYQEAIKGQKVEPAVAKMAEDFGDVSRMSFERWWFRTGRELFAQKRAMPRVKRVEDGTVIQNSEKKNRLYLEVPLTMRRSTALRQINKILGEYFRADDGGRHNVFAFSRAQRDINKRSKMRLSTFQQFYAVWRDRLENPTSHWWETGEKFNISPAFKNYPHTNPLDRAENCRNMNLTVQRIHRKTKKLIYWAARGEFPRVV